MQLILAFTATIVEGIFVGALFRLLFSPVCLPLHRHRSLAQFQLFEINSIGLKGFKSETKLMFTKVVQVQKRKIFCIVKNFYLRSSQAE